MVEDHPPPTPLPPIRAAIKARVATMVLRMTAGMVDTTLAAAIIAEAGKAVESARSLTPMLGPDGNPAGCHRGEHRPDNY
jgi:hypothetical protein